MNLHFRPVKEEDILDILPLIQVLNTKTPLPILKERILEMVNYQNYECLGAFDEKRLIGVCGLWYSMRHYIGKSVEPDHVIVDASYRGQNIGKKFFNYIYEYTKSKGCEAVELNTYTGNTKSHKFYYNEGFNIYGFHFLKVMRKDENFY